MVGMASAKYGDLGKGLVRSPMSIIYFLFTSMRCFIATKLVDQAMLILESKFEGLEIICDAADLSDR